MARTEKENCWEGWLILPFPPFPPSSAILRFVRHNWPLNIHCYEAPGVWVSVPGPISQFFLFLFFFFFNMIFPLFH